MLYVFAIIVGTLSSAVSSLGSNNCFTIVKKRRRSVKSAENKEVQLASHRESEKVTQVLDDSKKSVGRRRSQQGKESTSGWERMISNSMPKIDIPIS